VIKIELNSEIELLKTLKNY